MAQEGRCWSLMVSSSSSSSASGSSDEENDAKKEKQAKNDAAEVIESGSGSGSDSSSESSSESEKGGKKEKSGKGKKGKMSAKKKAMLGASSNQFGKFGVIKNEDFFNKKPEFLLWAMEVRKENTDQMGQMQMRDLFKEFVEDYNTATMPSKKYYNLQAWDSEMSVKRQKKHRGD